MKRYTIPKGTGIESMDPTKQVPVEWDRTFMRLPKEVKKAMQAEAKRRNVSLTSLTIHAMISFLREVEYERTRRVRVEKKNDNA